jgi:hypothetical protein
MVERLVALLSRQSKNRVSGITRERGGLED